MKVLNAVLNGTVRSVRSWKGVLITWFLSLLLVSMLTIPLKGSLISGFGNSMITGLFTNGLNIEAFVDLGSGLKSLLSSFSSGFFFLIFVVFLMNAFLTGGLFDSLRLSSGKFSSSEFFRTAANNFWSFFIITLIVTTMIIFLTIIIIIVPFSIIGQAESVPEKAIYNTILVCGSLLIILILILLLVADYARAWQVANLRPACFSAIGFGFRQAFSTFLSSFTLMIILVAVQILFGCLVMKILTVWRPGSGGGVFLLFLMSQILFIIKILLRAWRYGSVTSLMEQRLKTPVITSINL